MSYGIFPSSENMHAFSFKADLERRDLMLVSKFMKTIYIYIWYMKDITKKKWVSVYSRRTIWISPDGSFSMVWKTFEVQLLANKNSYRGNLRAEQTHKETLHTEQV